MLKGLADRSEQWERARQDVVAGGAVGNVAIHFSSVPDPWSRLLSLWTGSIRRGFGSSASTGQAWAWPEGVKGKFIDLPDKGRPSATDPIADLDVALNCYAERTLLAVGRSVGHTARMEFSKRSFIATIVNGSLAACVPLQLGRTNEGKPMYGLIGKMIAVDG